MLRAAGTGADSPMAALALDLDLLAFRLGTAAEQDAKNDGQAEAEATASDPIRAMARRMGLV